MQTCESRAYRKTRPTDGETPVWTIGALPAVRYYPALLQTKSLHRAGMMIFPARYEKLLKLHLCDCTAQYRTVRTVM